MKLMYSDKGGWAHAYNPLDEARLRKAGWVDATLSVKKEPDSTPVAEPVPEVEVPTFVKRGPGRPKKQ